MKKCVLCGLKILDIERGVLLHTFEGVKTIEKKYFHINCWIQHLEEKTNERVMLRLKALQEESKGMVIKLIDNLNVV